jgi:hypothetical protein
VPSAPMLQQQNTWLELECIVVVSVNIGCSEHPDYGACNVPFSLPCYFSIWRTQLSIQMREALLVYHIDIFFWRNYHIHIVQVCSSIWPIRRFIEKQYADLSSWYEV